MTGKPPTHPRTEAAASDPRVFKILLVLLLIVIWSRITWKRLKRIDENFIVETRNSLEPAIRSPAAQAFDLSQCNVPRDWIRSGGPPKDGIPALIDPKRVKASHADSLRPGDRVIGVFLDGVAVAYPLRILNWHECINDTVANRAVAVTYCPLCDSAFVFDRRVGGKTRVFGISGLLLNSNVLLYDRGENPREESLWSQVAMKAVCGPAAEAGLALELLPSELVPWEDWVSRHPGSEVVSEKTGYRRDYSQSPYKEYFETDALMFPVRNFGPPPKGPIPSFPNKERLLILIQGSQARVYPYSVLAKRSNKDGLVEDIFGSKRIRIRYDDGSNTARLLSPDPASPEIRIAYSFWFAWKAFRDGYEVFGEEE